MPRRISSETPSYFHVINRSVRRDRLFDTSADYEAFMAALGTAQLRMPMPLLAYCVMPNHFHLVVGPTPTAGLSGFMHRLTVIHAKRWHQYRGSVGTGPVYQGRFKAYPIEGETHFVFVCRYVERNPLRAGLVDRVECWPWSSAGRADRRSRDHVAVNPWPIPKPASWRELLNRSETGCPTTPGFL